MYQSYRNWLCIGRIGIGCVYRSYWNDGVTRDPFFIHHRELGYDFTEFNVASFRCGKSLNEEMIDGGDWMSAE